MSHVSTPLPEHLVVVGAQTPVQAPEMHAWLVQTAGVAHVPLESQVCTALPEHCTAPGLHDPEH